ncbi:M20 metallopeptidase family protein [Pseudobacillus wudalianchiensis]|uniref:N-acyl-L-amino acid amidohydrolase n=1 Tax=Pseudobacillus wudalianchiensis TaxID=1743143 RepID=A0A1B9AAF0_9BACI|nr:amidohydrolase [Bacillus wudalianchiensis]OCA80823.1 N-acyl-L-amino acid amidohydrolase [Bacillus wudalianchiensis]
MPVKQASLKEEVISWRRHLHENPELSFQEIQTSEYVYNHLTSFPGLEVTRPTKTSVLAVLKGSKTSVGKRPVVAFRADMDALPIQEEADIDFPSKNPGVMHACGHDAHTSVLLGAAKALSGMKEEISGEIRFIFQHAEEMPPGGAVELVEKGVIDGVDYAFALHVTPYEQAGKICMREGVLCAGNSDFDIKIIGYGGHASTPELTVDPIMVGAEIAINIQQIVSRKLPALKSPVISVTKFNGGSALNVIPETAELGGTIRSLDDDIRLQAKGYVNQIVKGITEAHGARYEIIWHEGYKSVVNDKEAVSITREVAENIVGKENVIHVEEPLFGGEDFSAFSRKVPASMQFIGVHNPDFGEAYPLHHPKFKIEEEALKIGVNYFIGIAKKICCQ